jgi:hypothetical protein
LAIFWKKEEKVIIGGDMLNVFAHKLSEFQEIYTLKKPHYWLQCVWGWGRQFLFSNI